MYLITELLFNNHLLLRSTKRFYYVVYFVLFSMPMYFCRIFRLCFTITDRF